jgi:hypothetical protein
MVARSALQAESGGTGLGHELMKRARLSSRFASRRNHGS